MARMADVSSDEDFIPCQTNGCDKVFTFQELARAMATLDEHDLQAPNITTLNELHRTDGASHDFARCGAGWLRCLKEAGT